MLNKKKLFLEEVLNRYKEVLVSVKKNHPGVVAPDSFKNGNNCILRIGYDVPVSANLKVDEKGFSADMPFSAGVVSYCEIPFDAIIGISVPGNNDNERKARLSLVKCGNKQ